MMLLPSNLVVHPTHTHPRAPGDTAFPTVLPDPPVIDRATATGHRTLWVVFVLMVIVFLGCVALSWAVPASKRIYHSITTLIILISTLAYFAMATGQGYTWHRSVHHHHHKGDLPETHLRVYHQIFYARYVDLILTTPLLLLNLAFLAGLNGATIFTLISADLVMVFSAMFSAFSHSKGSTWGWYAIACIAYLWIGYSLLFTGRSAANIRGSSVSKFYTTITVYTLIVWTIYPVIWAISERRILTVNREIIAFAVLDILLKGGFGIWLLVTHARVPETHVTLDGFWAHGLDSEGRIRVGDEDDDGA